MKRISTIKPGSMNEKTVCMIIFLRVFQMQQVGSTQGGSQRPFSVLDRLLLTHPVWLQLSLNKDAALYILLREPVGVRTYRREPTPNGHTEVPKSLQKTCQKQQRLVIKAIVLDVALFFLHHLCLPLQHV